MHSAITRTDEFTAAQRVNGALTASLERQALHWMAERMPKWLNSDHLTVLGVAAQMGAGLCYALARSHPDALLTVNLCLVTNWFGDSMDGTLARVRRQQRPRYGFYIDHLVDMGGAVMLMCGLGCSGLLHWPIAMGMLLGFLLLSGESYLATYTLSRFELSQGIFGPTEIRILLFIGNLALWRNPYATVFGHRVLLFDFGGAVAIAGMGIMLLITAGRHTSQLYREEPLP